MAPNPAVTETNWSPNYSPGRPDGDPLGIVIHHWGIDGQSHDGVVRYLCQDRGASSTSAHYVVSADKTTQIVHDYDRAWHCRGNNSRTIGIECRPEASNADYEAIAALIAAIRVEWGWLPLSAHSDHIATSCPGRYTPWLGWLSDRADQINNGTAPRPNAEQRRADGLAVDGVWGRLTTLALQAYYGTPQDGIISSQSARNRQYAPAAGTGWEWVADPAGSTVITALQRHIATPADGIVGYNTARSLQTRLGTTPDGYIGYATVATLQTRLNDGTL